VIVVADASPLNYLVLIGHADVLHGLYGRVVMPAGVASELRDPRSPGAVRTWASAPPEWVDVRTVQVPPDAGLDALDAGEAEAIVLAEAEHPNVLLIIDDRDGRRKAARRGIA
jgi:predicted nucleic acid-binding protein